MKRFHMTGTLLLLAIFLTGIKLITAAAKESNFIIKDGVLVKYNGTAAVVNIPEGITEIGKQAFFLSPATIVTIPEGVTKIGDRAFYSSHLKKINIPNSINEIGKEAFSTSKITEIRIPDCVTSIKDNTFNRCFKLKEIILPANLNSIGKNAFYSCTSLSNVTLPEGILRIGDGAFSNCTKLAQISIPKSVMRIGVNIFKNDSVLNKLQVSPENPYYTAEENILYNKSKTVLLSYPRSEGEIVLPEGIEEIGDEFFSKSYITKVTFPSTMKKLGNHVFDYCRVLEEIVLPDSLVSFGEQPFYCPLLKEIQFYDTEGEANFINEKGVIYNQDKTILYCNLAEGEIIVPDSVTSIAAYAFPNVKDSVTVPESVVSFGENIFVNEVDQWTPANEEPLCIYGYSQSAIEKYCNTTNWGVRFLALDGTYHITYYLNGGKNNSANPLTFDRDTNTIILKSPSRKGYIFQYWYEDYSICEDGCCRGERAIKKIPKGTLGDIVVYAKWEKKTSGNTN
jgi:uncharacterized repeat protein (TIGR02543 family)